MLNLKVLNYAFSFPLSFSLSSFSELAMRISEINLYLGVGAPSNSNQ